MFKIWGRERLLNLKIPISHKKDFQIQYNRGGPVYSSIEYSLYLQIDTENESEDRDGCKKVIYCEFRVRSRSEKSEKNLTGRAYFEFILLEGFDRINREHLIYVFTHLIGSYVTVTVSKEL